MKKLNMKNKLMIFIFTCLVIGIILILVFSVKLSKKNNSLNNYKISNNSVLFNQNSKQVDSSLGGTIEKKNNKFYFVNNKTSELLGNNVIIYEKETDSIKIFGTVYRIDNNGNVVINSEMNTITDLSSPSFYKLNDREYLIIASEIGNDDKTIYTNKYLIVKMDTQGNASLYNDSINIKTINPLKLTFGEYTFDIANEKLIIKDKSINLKLVIGSSNKFTPKIEDNKEYKEKVNFIEKYNDLVNDFSAYAKENNNVLDDYSSETNNFIVINDTNKKNTGKEKENKTKITKRFDLRGAIAYPTYIDITYLVTDPEDLYQMIYVIVQGQINGEMTTQKILLDKYSTTYRINGLSMKNEYSITVGDVEVYTDDEGNKSLIENIEDVIKVRTTSSSIKIKVNKIAKKRVYFTLNMSEDFAISSGKIALRNVGDELIDNCDIDFKQAITKDGFKGSLSIDDSDTFILKVEDAIYADKLLDIDTSVMFTYPN